MTIDLRGSKVESFLRQEHPRCFVCGTENSRGMQVKFIHLPDGSVEADACCLTEYQGYKGIMHGGLISSLLDEAMTQCMLARKTPALTAKLEVRYVHTVAIDSRLKVHARLVHSRPPLHELEAVVIKNGVVAARAKAMFYEKKG